MINREKNNSRLSILVVDDDPQQCLLLQMLLEKEEYHVFLAGDGEEALEVFQANPSIRLIITDLAMPIKNGFELIQDLRKQQIRYAYIIVLTAVGDQGSLLKALAEGADDFLTKPAMEEELQLRIKNGLQLLEMQSHEELIFALAKLAEYRSNETGCHLERVRQYTSILAMDLADNSPELKITYAVAEEISKVSPLHDIGKVATPDHILHKTGKLTDEEFEIMKKHAMIGGSILEEIYLKNPSPYLQIAYEIASCHHEKYDGTGYPAQLAGDDIPVSARIMALADVYDALTSIRCYKSQMSHAEAREIIIKERGVHFDPRVVDAFLRQEHIWLTVLDNYIHDEVEL